VEPMEAPTHDLVERIVAVWPLRGKSADSRVTRLLCRNFSRGQPYIPYMNGHSLQLLLHLAPEDSEPLREQITRQLRDRIASVIDDAERRERLGAAARERSRLYQVDESMRRTWDLLTSLATEPA